MKLPGPGLEPDDDAIERFGRLASHVAAFLHDPRLPGCDTETTMDVLERDTAVPRLASELAILVVVQHWSSREQLHRHRQRALEDGLDEAVVDALAVGGQPVLEPKLDAVHRFVHELLQQGDIADDTLDAIVDLWGPEGAVDLAVIIAVHGMLACARRQ